MQGEICVRNPRLTYLPITKCMVMLLASRGECAWQALRNTGIEDSIIVS